MAQYIVVYAKYGLVLFLFLFLGTSLWALRYESVREQKRTALFQSIFLFLTQFCAYLTIVIRTQRMEYLLFYLFLQILTVLLPALAAFLYPGLSRVLLNQMCMLLSAGMIVLTRLDIDKAVRQLAIAGASFLIGLAVPWGMQSFRSLKKTGLLYACAGIAALAAVLIAGQVTNGSRLSFQVAGITLQPSELIKLLYVFFIASMLDKSTGLKQVFLTGLLAAAHVLILVLSKDLGSALIFFAAYVFMVTIAAHQPLYFVAGCVLGAAASVVAYQQFSHVQVRVQAWKDPWSVIDSQGYQITQSLFAMSRGGLFGLGIGKGTPRDIPYVETDFIFAAMAEELGLLFAIGIVVVSICCFLQMMRLAAGLKDGFYKTLTAGFATMYLFQIFLTVGGGTKFIPLTGVTLPFISYGGSSILSSTLLFAIVQGVFVMRYREEERIEKRRKKAKSEKEKVEK